MHRGRAAGTLLAAALLAGCTSSGGPSQSRATAAPTTAPLPLTTPSSPSTAPSMNAQVITACTHIRNAFYAEQPPGQDWKLVMTEIAAAWHAAQGGTDRQLADLIPPTGSLRLDDTQTLGEVTDTLAFACGLPTRPMPGSSPAAPSRKQVQVSVAAVDDVRLGTGAAEAERRLRASLGDADVADAGCGGETVKRLTWGSFSVLLGSDAKGRLALGGWTLRTGVSRVSYAMPYDVVPGDAVRDVLNRVPGAVGVTGEGETGGSYVVHTDRAPGLLWISDDKGRTGVVAEVTFNDPSCD